MRKSIFLLISIFVITSESYGQSTDPKVNSLIEKTESAMGGQDAYQKIKHISWNFFNNRTLTWNKHNGDLRIDLRKENSVYLYNINDGTGKILKNDVELTQVDSIAKYTKEAYSMWVNDSYWLLMPFKLADEGVTTTYIGERTADNLQKADVLQLTFSEVGVTPDNKYMVYIDKKTGLVSQWDFFSNHSDVSPRFSTAWLDYKTYGNVKISGDRGNNKITDIHVFKKLDNSIYSSFERPSFIR